MTSLSKISKNCAFIVELGRGDSLGVELLTAILRIAGHKVFLYLDKNQSATPWIKSQRNLEEKKLLHFIEQNQIEIAFFSVATDYALRAQKIAQIIKCHKKEILTCFGGVHPTFAHEELLQNPAIDFVCRGEGEIAIEKFVESLSSKTAFPSGIYYRENNRIAGSGLGELTKNLDELPFPDKSDFYEQMPFIRNYYTIQLSRGCPGRCSYCNSPSMMDLYRDEKQVFFRRRSVASAIEELKIVKKVYRPKKICFVDDTFILDKTYMREFALQYKKHINIPFYCNTQPNFFDEEILDLLVDAGMSDVEIGVQSFCPRIKEDIYLRNESNDDVLRFVALLRNRKVFTHIDHIVSPWETTQDLEEQLPLYEKLRPSQMNVFFLSLYPGTKILNRTLEENIITNQDYRAIQNGNVNTNYYCGGSVSQKELQKNKGALIFLSLLPLIPSSVCRYIIKKKYYQYFKILPHMSVFLIRGIIALSSPKDTWGRMNLGNLYLQYLDLFNPVSQRRITEIRGISTFDKAGETL